MRQHFVGLGVARAALWCGLGLAASIEAAAQTAPPQTPAPGTIGRPEDVRRIDPEPLPRGRVRVRSQSAVPAAPCPDALTQSALTFPLSRIELVRPDGSPVAPPLRAALARVTAMADGQSRPVRDVCTLRDEANADLIRAGYVAVTQIGPQSLAGGTLRLTIISGRIVEVRPRGNAGRFERPIARITRRLTELDPLRTSDAEGVVLRAGDLPGVDVSLVLAPAEGGAPGDLIAELQIQRIGATLYGGVQNLGSEQVGRWGAQIRGEVYGLTGLADQTFAGAYLTTDTREQLVVQAGHSMQLWDRGPRLSGSAALSFTRPDLGPQGRQLNYESDALFATVQLEQHLIRRVTGNLSVAGGLDLINQDVTTARIRINQDRLRVGFLRLSGNLAPRRRVDVAPVLERAVTLSGSGYIEVRQGFDILDSTPNYRTRLAQRATIIPTRLEGQPHATVFRGQAGMLLQYAQPTQPVFGLFVQARGQYTDVPLLGGEEYAIGNLTLGRGYDPGANSGDTGAGFSAELRLGRPIPRTTRSLAWELFTFWDQNWLWNYDTGTLETNRVFKSFGAGLRGGWGDHVRVELTYASPLDRNLATDARLPPDRVLFTLSTRFFPFTIGRSRT
jgi:hemolysin activation/secretion protein